MTPNQKPLTKEEAASDHASDYDDQRGFHIAEKSFIAGWDAHASLPSNDKQGQETPVDEDDIYDAVRKLRDDNEYGVTEEVKQKMIAKSDGWNDEIRPHILKGINMGWIMRVKEERSRSIDLLKFVELSGLTYRKTHEKWERWVKEGYSTQVLKEYTTEQLYEMFLHSIEK